METIILKPNIQSYEKAAQIIKQGGLVAFPTETVYGLGANALDEQAAKKIYAVKGRPSDNPLIIHVADKEDISKYCFVPDTAKTFIDEFMPGAVTAVFKKKELIPDAVTGGLKTVAVRIPSNSIAREFIRSTNLPICAPSANTSSKPSPTLAIHVYEDLSGKIPYIIDGGSCDIGIESTIIDFSGERPRLLRPGGVPIEKIEAIIGKVERNISADRPLCPGMKYKHYSPKAQVYLYKKSMDVYEFFGNEQNAFVGYEGDFELRKNVYVVKNDYEYAKLIFAIFRECDSNGVEKIFCPIPMDNGIGASLHNRLIKAAGGKIVEEK